MSASTEYTYDFTSDEVKLLTLFMRAHEEELPVGLEDFFSSIENYIYNSMTIDEAEKFFNEKKNI